MDEGNKNGEKNISRKKNDSDNEEEPKKQTSKPSRNEKKPNTKPSKKRGASYSESDNEGKRDKNKKSLKNKKETTSETIDMEKGKAKDKPKEKEKSSKDKNKEKPKKDKSSSESNDEDTNKPCKPQKRNKMVLDDVHDSDKEIDGTIELSRPPPIGEKVTTKKQPEKKKKKEESEEEDNAPKKVPAKKKQEESESDSDSEKKKKLKSKQAEKKTTEMEPDKKAKDKQANKKKNTSSESSESEDLKATKKEHDKTVKQGKKKIQNKTKIFNDISDSDTEEEKDQPTAIRQSTIQDLHKSTRNALFPTDQSEYLSFRSLMLIDESTKKNILVSTKLFTIGRDERSSLKINQEKVSLNQCEIFSNEDRALLFDKNSTNGTFLQLRPGNAYQIRKNMVVEMGRSLFMFKREKKQKKFVLQGSAGRMLGKTIREFKKGEEKFKVLVLGKQTGNDKNGYLCLEDEGIEDEHGLILNIGKNFFIMPLESEKGIWVKIGGKNTLEIDSDCCILKEGDRIKFGEDQILRVHKSEFVPNSICPCCQNHVAYFDFSCKNMLFCKNCIKNPENNQCRKCKTEIVNRRRVFY